MPEEIKEGMNGCGCLLIVVGFLMLLIVGGC